MRYSWEDATERISGREFLEEINLFSIYQIKNVNSLILNFSLKHVFLAVLTSNLYKILS